MQKLLFKLFFTSLLFSCLLFITSCDKEDDTPPENDPTLIDIGQFNLLQESIDLLPYLNKTEIIFVDSLQTEETFTLTEYESSFTNGMLFRYDVFEPGDTVRYKYESQRKLFHADNDSLGIRFRIELNARPYYPDPESGAVADVINISWIDQNNITEWNQVFNYIVNTRTYPQSFNEEPIEEIEFFGKVFYDVLTNNFISTVSEVHFNQEFGIVSFTDKTGKLWRFKELK